MKKALIYILALSALCAALTGCGDTRDERNNTMDPASSPDLLPDMEELIPGDMEPDMDDGIVNDTDGIITDNGREADPAERGNTQDTDQNRNQQTGTVTGRS